MIRVALDFARTMLRFPAGWLIWIAALILVNGVAPIVFLPAPEAVITLATFMLAAMLQMALFGRLGFVRLLGIGHVPWLALVPWAWLRSGVLPVGSPMRIWLTALVLLNTGSLLIDAADVVRYLRGEREPVLRLDVGPDLMP